MGGGGVQAPSQNRGDVPPCPPGITVQTRRIYLTDPHFKVSWNDLKVIGLEKHSEMPLPELP